MGAGDVGMIMTGEVADISPASGGWGESIIPSDAIGWTPLLVDAMCRHRLFASRVCGWGLNNVPTYNRQKFGEVGVRAPGGNGLRLKSLQLRRDGHPAL